MPCPLRPAPEGEGDEARRDFAGVAVPLRLRAGGEVLSFISTTTVFGTPVDITLSEIALETFFPADAATAAALRSAAAARDARSPKAASP